jgi:hypothetical protein
MSLRSDACVAYAIGELGTGSQGLEHGERLLNGLTGLHGVSGTPQDVGEPAKRVAFLTRVAEITEARDRTPERIERFVCLVGEVALVRPPLQQFREFTLRQRVGVLERPSILGSRLTVGAQGGCAFGSGGGITQNSWAVSGGVGVMREPFDIRRAPRGIRQGSKRPAVEGETAIRRERLLHGDPRELVAERDAVGRVPEHPGCQALVERIHVFCGKRLEQPEFGPWTCDGDRFQQGRRT